MRHKDKFYLVRDERSALGSVSSLSDEEQARYADLADIALKQKQEPTAPVGSRAHEEHELLKKDLLDTLDQLKLERDEAA